MAIRGFALYFTLNLLNTQAQNFDSLKVVASQLKHDSDRVILLCQEGFEKRALDPQYSYDCAMEAEDCAQKSNLPLYVARASNLLGILYDRKGDLTNALVYHKKALALRLLTGDKPGVAMSQTNLGNVYAEMKKYALAEAAYLEAVAYNYETGQAQQTGNCLLSLGLLNLEQKNLSAAENYLNAAIANAKKSPDPELEALALNNLSVLNIAKQNYDAAIENALASLALKKQSGNVTEMADSYLNLSEACLKKGDYKRGMAYLKSADSIILKSGYTAARLNSLMKHSDFDAQNKNYEGAYNNLRLFHALKDSLDETNALAKTENNFIERKIVESSAQEAHEKHFPYALLISLCVMALGCVLFLLRARR